MVNKATWPVTVQKVDRHPEDENVGNQGRKHRDKIKVETARDGFDPAPRAEKGLQRPRKQFRRPGGGRPREELNTTTSTHKPEKNSTLGGVNFEGTEPEHASLFMVRGRICACCEDCFDSSVELWVDCGATSDFVTTKPTPDTVHSPTPGQLHVESIQLACTCALCCCYALCMKREELSIFYSLWLRCSVVMLQYVGFLGRSQLFGSQVKVFSQVGAPSRKLARQKSGVGAPNPDLERQLVGACQVSRAPSQVGLVGGPWRRQLDSFGAPTLARQVFGAPTPELARANLRICASQGPGSQLWDFFTVQECFQHERGMKPGVFQGEKFPFTPKRRKISLGSQCNNIKDTRHDLAAFRSKLANVPWLRSYIYVDANCK